MDGLLMMGIVVVIVFIPIVIVTAKTIGKRSLQNSLLEAVRNHDKEGVQELIAKGIDINDQYFQSHGGFPIGVAVKNSDKEMVSFLIEKGANVNYADQEYPLVMAVKNGDKDIISVLIDNGANVNSFTKPLDFAKDEETITLLRSHGAITQKEQDEADIDFVNAVSYHDAERVKQLIPRISDIDIIPAHGYDKPNMPKDVFKLVYFLYNRNTDKVEEYKQGNVTPLIYAAACDDIETVKLLVENGANVNARTSDGLTALMYAVMVMVSDVEREHTVELIDFLIDKGANINEKSYDSYNLIAITALMFATMNGNIEAVAALIRNGADVNAKASNGSTALSLAEYRGHTEIAVLLKKNGA